MPSCTFFFHIITMFSYADCWIYKVMCLIWTTCHKKPKLTIKMPTPLISYQYANCLYQIKVNWHTLQCIISTIVVFHCLRTVATRFRNLCRIMQLLLIRGQFQLDWIYPFLQFLEKTKIKAHVFIDSTTSRWYTDYVHMF